MHVLVCFSFWLALIVLSTVQFYEVVHQPLLKVDLSGLSRELAKAADKVLQKKQIAGVDPPLAFTSVDPVARVSSAVAAEYTAISHSISALIHTLRDDLIADSQVEIFYDSYVTSAGRFEGSYEPLSMIDASKFKNVRGAGGLYHLIQSVQALGNIANPQNIQRCSFSLSFAGFVMIVVSLVCAGISTRLREGRASCLIRQIAHVLLFTGGALMLTIGVILCGICSQHPLDITFSLGSSAAPLAIVAAILAILPGPMFACYHCFSAAAERTKKEPGTIIAPTIVNASRYSGFVRPRDPLCS